MKIKSDLFNYKGYYGSINWSKADNVFFGQIEFIKDLVTYESDHIQDLQKQFESAVDDYLDCCKKRGREPDKSFKGSLNIRISDKDHKAAYFRAVGKDMSLNSFIKMAIKNELLKK